MSFSYKIDPRKTACTFFISVTKNAIKTRDVSIFSQKQSDYANNFHFPIRDNFFFKGTQNFKRLFPFYQSLAIKIVLLELLTSGFF